jgi:hypothetical protein
MAASKVSSIPHSWALTEWPKDVYPHDASKARYILRSHRDSLIAIGELTRIGRDPVVFGAGYNQWLHLQAGKVAGFDIAPNREHEKPGQAA